MSTEKPHFLARRLTDHQRSLNRPLKCPLCSNVPSFTGVPRLLDHAKATHLDTADHYPNGQRWQQYYNDASAKAKQKNTRKLEPDPQPVSKQSSNGSMQNNIGDDTRSRSTYSRPAPASASRPSDPRIDDFNRLRIDQGTDPPGDPQPSPANPNRLKRSAIQSSGPDQPRNVVDGRGPPKNRRTKALSGGSSLATIDKDFGRDGKPAVSRRLFEPNIDGTSDANLPKGQSGSSPLQNRDLRTQGRDKKENNLNKGTAPGSSSQAKEPSRSEAAPPNNESPRASVDAASLHNYTDVSENSETSDEPELLLQPETRPISHEQLVVEVKGIYAGLVMVEAKCMDVDEKQAIAAQEKDPSKQSKLTYEQWSALIALHKTLLHEHHDFFLASQHPSASPALSRLAAKYSMPARMWRHGIHAFLEVLRHRLPDSLDHMLAFIYIAYSMMALLYETVPSFEDTWIECLGDLGRYRMAIEDDDVGDREVWSGVARFWYGKAADKSPKIGRLYHHLAILAKQQTINQLSLYARSLTCTFPFESAKGSILTLFNPILSGQHSKHHKSSSIEIMFLKAHALLYTGQSTQQYEVYVQQLLSGGLFEKLIERAGAKFKEVGVLVAICSAAALLEYGACRSKGGSRSLIRLALEVDRARRENTKAQLVEESKEVTPSQSLAPSVEDLSPEEFELSRNAIAHACTLVFGLLAIALNRPLDKNVYPMIHTYLVLIWQLCPIDEGMKHIERDVPWSELVSWLNTFATAESMTSRVTRKAFPKPENKVIGRPLPEDFSMRGQPWSDNYCTEDWFYEAAIDDEERTLELPSMADPRQERMLWLGHGIASHGKWILYDDDSKKFSEALYVKELRPRESKRSLQAMSLHSDFDTVMSGMNEGEEIPFSILDSPLQPASPNDLEPEQEPVSPKKMILTKPPTILKRPKEDVEMVDPKMVKQEETSSPPKSIGYDSEEWLKGQGSDNKRSLLKHNPEDYNLQANADVADLVDVQRLRDPSKPW